VIKPTFNRPGVDKPIKSKFYHPGWSLDFLVNSRLGEGEGDGLPVDPPLSGRQWH